MTSVSFYTNDAGFADYRTDDDRYIPLGVWYVMELRDSPYQCLDLLAIVDDIVNGRADVKDWDGEAFQARLTSSGVAVRNTVLDNQQGEYSLDEVRRLAEQYWRYLADNPRVAEDVVDWERVWKRTHPYRGRLPGL